MPKIILFLTIIFLFSCTNDKPEPAKEIDTDQFSRVFSFSLELTLKGTPDYIYDGITGDISDWWDHSFSENPAQLYIEPKPGGGFWEIFDDNGDGVLHARVIYAHRAKILRFAGPLGLSGNAVNIVHTYNFSPIGSDSTKLVLDVHGEGDISDDTPETVKKVWKHFLIERFKPYIENKDR